MRRDDDLPVDPDAPARARRRAGDPAVFAAVAGGGALGALARAALAAAVPAPPSGVPWSTFAINVSGSLLLGFVVVVLAERWVGSRLARPLLATGFLGSYTTFSTYVVEADQLWRHGRAATAAAYAVASVLVGAFAALAGIAGGRLVARGGLARRSRRAGGRR